MLFFFPHKRRREEGKGQDGLFEKRERVGGGGVRGHVDLCPISSEISPLLRPHVGEGKGGGNEVRGSDVGEQLCLQALKKKIYPLLRVCVL